MAVDEALLLEGPPAALRLYSWSPPGLSLGYFQPHDFTETVPGDRVVVRRQTGGGAIYHDNEITFSLTLDTELLPGSVLESYEAIHGAIARALDTVGVPTAMAAQSDVSNHRRPAQGWCFATPSAPDLITVEGRKIVGSAQRRINQPRPRILHHGSIVLRASPTTPFCGDVTGHVDPADATEPLKQALIHEISATLQLKAEPSSLGASLRSLAGELLTSRHGTREFLERR
jgi:lipoate-protein ligase A